MITFRKLSGFGRAGIGNKLFQYAGSRLYASIHTYDSAFPAWDGKLLFSGLHSYTPYEHCRALLLPTYQLDDLQSWSRLERIKYELGLQRKLPITHNIKDLYERPRDNLNFYGYLQDPLSRELLRTHRTLVRSWLPLHDHLINWIDETIKLRGPWTGVHIRRGDFIKLGLSLSPEHYHEVLRSRPTEQLYISSNDPKMRASFRDYPLFEVENPFPELPGWAFDFLMLMRSQYIIGCGSTFSWWAAFLGDHNTYMSPPLVHEWPTGYQPQFSEQEL